MPNIVAWVEKKYPILVLEVGQMIGRRLIGETKDMSVK